jgi:probable HAF family extracellular repeat protein
LKIAIAGWTNPDGMYGTAAQWQNGTITTLNLPPNYSSWGNAINNAGQIVVNINAHNGSGGTLFQTGIWQNGVTLESDLSWLFDLNDSGRAIGNYTGSNGYERAYKWYNGQTTDLGSLGGEGT